MRNVGPDGRRARLPDELLRLDSEFAEILALLDGPTATHRMMAGVPDLAGVHMAWVGEPGGPDQIVLQHTVNVSTTGVTGLVVPVGTGLGGKVLAARRPMWVGDYCASADITHHFKGPAAAEGIKAMIAVPIVRGGNLMGVLYGANRGETAFGDRTTQALERVAVRVAAAEVVAERARHAAEVAVHEERRRLAVELHDTVGAMLFTLRAGIEQLGDEPQLDEQVRARLTVIEGHAVEAAAALRGSLRVLSAPPEQVALGVALREHCRAFKERAGVNARLITLTELPTLPRASIMALAGAAREALLNVEKHARASSVVVSVFCHNDGVAVTISDDGVGLGDELGDITSGAGWQSARREGLGLVSISERLGRIGGTLTVANNEDGGAKVQAWIPR